MNLEGLDDDDNDDDGGDDDDVAKQIFCNASSAAWSAVTRIASAPSSIQIKDEGDCNGEDEFEVVGSSCPCRRSTHTWVVA